VISQGLVVCQGKGGVGKTCTTAAIASLAAASGWRVLIIDLDPQGNIAREFGYTSVSDRGEGLYQSVYLDQPLRVLQNVRPNIDVVPGGERTRLLADSLMIESTRNSNAFERFNRVVTEASADYDLVVVDTPPGDLILQRAILGIAHYVLVPTSGDAASTDGLAIILSQIVNARGDYNPDLELLGVVVNFIPTNAKALDRQIRENLRELLGDVAPVFSPSIRINKMAAIGQRDAGVQVLEYERLKKQNDAENPWYKSLGTKESIKRYSSGAAGLASDYQKLVNEILTAFTKRQSELGYS